VANIQHDDLTRTTLSILFIVGLIAASLWILGPFLPAVIWATMIVVATWPLMLRVQAMLWGRRSLAVAVMTIALLLVFVVPFSLAIGTIIANADVVVGWVKSIGTVTLPAPPDWLQAVPLVGPKTASAWSQLVGSAPEDLAQKIAPYVQSMARWFLEQVGSLGLMTAQFLLTVIIAAILFATGETAATGLRRFGQRLAGAQGEHAIRLAGQAIRGVALGVVVVAFGQAVLGGIGLAVTGVPFAAILTALMFMLCLVQIGPAPVLVCAIVWLYWKGITGWGTVLVVWSIVVGTLDNVVRPILIMKGADLPLLLIFSGVIGGLIAFGLVGIFVGPMILAVAFMLLGEWLGQEPVEDADPVRGGPEAT
jgi:predicted PurR-regulated permease PerM